MLKKAEHENIFCINFSERAICLCNSKGIDKAVRMEGSDLRFKENVFDLVIDSDVPEHIGNDFQALFEWKKVLKKRSYEVAFVQAFKSFCSGNDVVNRLFRRYNKSELLARLEKAG